MEIDKEQVRATLRSVAKDIRRHGHFQRGHSRGSSLYGPGYNPMGLCCVNVNPTRRRSGDGAIVRDLDVALDIELRQRTGHHNVVDWNDTTPTAEVLAVLEQ